MREIEVKAKVVRTSYVLIQGEKNISTLVFVLPAEYEGTDISALIWEIKAVNLSSDSFFVNSLNAGIDGAFLRIPWTVGEEYTGKDGDLCVTLTGRQDDEIRAKFQIQGITVRKECEASGMLQPDYFEVVLAQVQTAATRAEAAATAADAAATQAQSIIQGGVAQINAILEQGMLVQDPVTGRMVTVQVALFSLYGLHRDGALTAGEYAALNLTAAQYASYGLTAEQYAFHGKSLLGG